jgi:hypothetical protein
LNEYEVQYAESCLPRLAQAQKLCKDSEVLDEVHKALSQKPHVFYEHKPKPPLGPVRIAKTLEHQRGKSVIPPMTFYFTIMEKDKIVRVHNIQIKLLDESDLTFDANLDFLD